jgi:hypothetical protein
LPLHLWVLNARKASQCRPVGWKSYHTQHVPNCGICSSCYWPVSAFTGASKGCVVIHSQIRYAGLSRCRGIGPAQAGGKFVRHKRCAGRFHFPGGVGKGAIERLPILISCICNTVMRSSGVFVYPSKHRCMQEGWQLAKRRKGRWQG